MGGYVLLFPSDGVFRPIVMMLGGGLLGGDTRGAEVTCLIGIQVVRPKMLKWLRRLDSAAALLKGTAPGRVRVVSPVETRTRHSF